MKVAELEGARGVAEMMVSRLDGVILHRWDMGQRSLHSQYWPDLMGDYEPWLAEKRDYARRYFGNEGTDSCAKSLDSRKSQQ
jgi:hypothetical protein